MGQGYTRNDTSNNIADGNVINASDLDGEFNAVDAAFNESSGHTHDGTADEGAPVTVLGPVQDFVASATEIKPKTSNTLDIGTASLQFKDMYLDGSAYIDGLGEDILVATDKKVQFRDAALFINSSTDGQLDIAADTEVEITTALVEISADATVGDDLTLKSDAAVLGFGADTDVTLTHVADTGLLVNAAMVVQFRDSAINIGSPADGDLDINADDEIELNSTLIDINGNVEISGTLSQTGIATFTDDIIIGDGKTIGSASAVDAMTISSGGIVTFKDDILIKDGGTIGVASDADAITIASNGQLTLTQTLIGTALDISGDIDVDGTTNLDVVDIDGAVDMASTLQVDGSITSSDGMTITTADNSSQLTLTSTDADGSVGPRFDLKRDSGSPADSDNLGRMRYLFDNDAAEQTEGVRIDAVLTDASDGTEDVSYVIDTMIAGTLRERIGLDATETVFNEDSQDIDFRIESNANANCFFVNAGTSNVGINGAPAHELDVLANDTDGDATIRVKAGTTSGSVAKMNITTAATAGDRESRLAFGDAANANIGKIAYHHDDDSMRFTTNAAERMRLTSNTFTMFNGSSAKLLFQRDDTTTIAGNDLGAIEFSHTDSTDAGTAAKILGEGDGSSGEGRIAFYTGTPSSLTESMRIGSDGNVGIGSTSTSFLLDVRGNVASNYLAYFFNDGNNSNRYGVLVQAGADSGDGTLIGFNDGNGTGIGGITFSGGTVTYGAFTAQHPCIIPDADNDPDSDLPAYPYGTLLETTSLSYIPKSDGTDSERGIRYHVRKTQTANSKAVLGAYGCSMNGGPENQTNEHQALVLGDGHILCNNSGGNIEMGDGICSSAAAGIGQKATANPSMIIGIAQEAVTFSSDTETKLVAVQYGLQQFIPWS